MISMVCWLSKTTFHFTLKARLRQAELMLPRLQPQLHLLACVHVLAAVVLAIKSCAFN
jgi:hypothetical protein